MEMLKTIVQDASDYSPKTPAKPVQPATTSPFTLPINFNPLDYLNQALAVPGNTINSITGNLTANVNHVLSNDCILSNCSKTYQTTNTNNTTVQTVNGNNNNTSSTPITSVTPTNTQPTGSPNIDLSGLLTLFSTMQNKSPGATAQTKNPLDDLMSILPIAVIGIIAVLGIYMFTRK